jgi:hypothetical protein
MRNILRLVLGYFLLVIALGAVFIFGQSIRLTCFESEGEAVCYTQQRLYGIVPIGQKEGLTHGDVLTICDPYQCHLEFQGLLTYVYDVPEGNRVVNFLAAPQEEPMQVYFINMPLSFAGFVLVTMPFLIVGVILIASAFKPATPKQNSREIGEE